MTSKSCNFKHVTNLLEKRAKNLKNHEVLTFGNEAANEISISIDDQALLTFVATCQFIGIPHSSFIEKFQKIKEKVGVSPNASCEFFLFAENVKMTKISSELTSWAVIQIWERLQENKDLNRGLITPSNSINEKILEQHEGLKTTLFLYMVRHLELQGRLNRIYTHHLEKCMKSTIDKFKKDSSRTNDVSILRNILKELQNYAIAQKPSGYCLILCVTVNRSGAENEADNVKETFENLGYDVDLICNPDVSLMLQCAKNLDKVKYSFYDSFIFWIIAHGDTKHVILGEGAYFRRKALIDEYSSSENFKKKPKLFFMTTCQGEKFIPLKTPRKLSLAI